MPGPRRFSSGLQYAAAGALSLSVMSAFAKLVGSRIPVQEIILFRGAVFGMLTYLLLRRRGVSPWACVSPLLVLRGLLGYSALTCFFWAVMHLPLADTTTLHFTNPVFGAVLAVFVLGEGLRPREAMLILLSLGGVALVARPAFLFGQSEALPALAVGVALLGAVLAAGAGVAVRRLTRTHPPLVIVFYFALVTVVGSLPFNVASFVPPTGKEWLLLLGAGLATFGGQVLITYAYRLEKAARVMAVGYLQIVFAAVLGLSFFGEVPAVSSVVGAAVIIGCTFLMARTRTLPEPALR